MSARLLQKRKHGALWQVGKEMLFLTEAVRRNPEREQTRGLNQSTEACVALAEILAAERLLISTRGAPYLFTGKEYAFAGQNSMAAQMMLSKGLRFGCSPVFPLNLETYKIGKIPNASAQTDLELLAAREEVVFSLVDSVPRSYGEAITTAAQTKLALPVDGLLLHPYAGEPEGAWVQRRPWVAPRAAPDPAYPHLRKLFSALPLAPASHAALHMYLLGVFHACSLEQEHPILFIDSWVRGRGKSEVCAAIQLLLEGTRCAIEASPGRQAFHDTIVAHLVGGSRVIPVHNLSGRAAYESEFFATMATEGGIEARPKYGRDSERFLGVLPIFNGVYGAFSLAEDFLCRCWRVELPGPAQVLTPRPREYAAEHRDEIIAEILAAHEPRPWFQRPHTRFAAFEAVSAQAYGRAFSLAPDAVSARIRAAQKSASALLPSAVQSLYSSHPKAFEAPHTDVVGDQYATGKKSPPPAGASALGFTFDGDVWHED